MKKLLLLFILLAFSFFSYSQSRRTKESKEELRERSPNRIVLRIGAGLFANYTYDIDKFDETTLHKKFDLDNFTYSGMLGYRSGFNSDNYRFSSTGRDMNRGNVVALFYQGGSIDAEGLLGLNKDQMKLFISSLNELDDPNFNVKFSELQVGVVWREFLRISGGRGSITPIEDITIDNFNSENMDYLLFTTGVNLRFGRLCPTFNWTLMSADNFETTMSRFDIQICINMYFWKKILHKDKHLITD